MQRVYIFASFYRGPQLVCTLNYAGKQRTNKILGLFIYKQLAIIIYHSSPTCFKTLARFYRVESP
jgi:hypothetical protein